MGSFCVGKEWQARQREKTKEWHAYRAKEEEKENMKMEEYREIGSRLKGYPEEEVRQAKLLVSKFLKAGEDIEKVFCTILLLIMKYKLMIFPFSSNLLRCKGN